MGTSVSRLRFGHFDSILARLRNTAPPPTPTKGWIHAIRTAMGMPATAIARKLGVRNSSVLKFEQSEADGKISLATLRKVADAMGCDLHYALVPRKPLEELLRDRALEVAYRTLAPVAHTMALENQALSDADKRLQIELFAKELLNGPRRSLWQD